MIEARVCIVEGEAFISVLLDGEEFAVCPLADALLDAVKECDASERVALLGLASGLEVLARLMRHSLIENAFQLVDKTERPSDH